MSEVFFRRGILFTVTGVIFYLFPVIASGQATTIATPESHQTYSLPDPATIQSASSAQTSITTAESAAKGLLADAATEKAAATAGQNAYNKAETEKNDYLAGINSFSKNDVAPYNLDLNNYNAAGTKFTQSLSKYNDAVKANNALAAKDRKQATVTALTKQKVQIDTTSAQLAKWKTRLDIAKAKLDVKNASLQKQQKKYEADEKATLAKLKTAKSGLTGISGQLTVCANYAARCKALITDKFKDSPAPTTSYFDGTEYKNALADLVSTLVKLKDF